MKLAIGLVLGTVLLGISVVSLAGGYALWTRAGVSDDFWAALVMGGLMLIAGGLTVIASLKAHKHRRAVARGAPVQTSDTDAASVLYGVGMATLTDDVGD